MKVTLCLVMAAAATFAAAAWLKLVLLLGGNILDAIRIPATAAMIAGCIWWPIYIRRAVKEKRATDAINGPLAGGKGVSGVWVADNS